MFLKLPQLSHFLKFEIGTLHAGRSRPLLTNFVFNFDLGHSLEHFYLKFSLELDLLSQNFQTDTIHFNDVSFNY